MAMERILTDMPEETVKRIEEVAARRKISRAEFIRRAVDQALATEAQTSFESAFGAWSDFDEDAVEYQRRLRREWE
jgi:metal-responsive CopG/Arc/MetJ family transcriptional regulator